MYSTHYIAIKKTKKNSSILFFYLLHLQQKTCCVCLYCFAHLGSIALTIVEHPWPSHMSLNEFFSMHKKHIHPWQQKHLCARAPPSNKSLSHKLHVSSITNSLFPKKNNLLYTQKMKQGSDKSGIICLVDAAYVLKGYTGNIDYIDIRRKLQEFVGARFDSCILYNSNDGSEKSAHFTAMMKQRHFDVKLFGLKTRSVRCSQCKRLSHSTIQKGVDVAIVTDLLTMAFKGEFDTVVLVAGDGDFAAALRQIKNMWRNIVVAGFKKSMSRDLMEVADKMYWF